MQSNFKHQVSVTVWPICYSMKWQVFVLCIQIHKMKILPVNVKMKLLLIKRFDWNCNWLFKGKKMWRILLNIKFPWQSPKCSLRLDSQHSVYKHTHIHTPAVFLSLFSSLGGLALYTSVCAYTWSDFGNLFWSAYMNLNWFIM